MHSGDALDFWRVLLADKEGKRLLLYAEMKLPGEAWLEFKIDEQNVLTQTATSVSYTHLDVYKRQPQSVYLAKGSEVFVKMPKRIKA